MSRVRGKGSRLVATAILLAAVFAADRTVFFLRDCLGKLCVPSADTTPVMEAISISFDVASPCFATGIELTKGSVYRFEVYGDAWNDGSLAADANGLLDVPLKLVVAGPFRRHVLQRWMKLMGRVGETATTGFVIGRGRAVYKAEVSGELFLYVNDAVLGFAPGRHWALPYYWSRGKNVGTARVTVSQVHGVDGVL